MAILEDAGLILRVMRYRETSRIVVALTRRHGKIHLLAKGAREYKKGFGGALEALTCSQLVLYHKKNRDLHLLHSAFVLRAYLRILRDPETYHLASAATEFILRVLPDEDPVPEIFAELGAWLARCDRRPGRVTHQALKAFQLRVVALLGYAPRLAHCAHCGGKIAPPVRFGVAEGGVLCDRCPAMGATLRVDRPALVWLRHLAQGAGTAGVAPGGAGTPTGVTPGGAETPAGAAPGEAGALGEAGAPGEDAAIELPLTVERQVAEIIEAFLRYHITGYRGLRSLKSLTAWRALRRRGAPPAGRAADDRRGTSPGESG
ncbi:MAG: DNA repair protein RecO [Candidatus Eisenbacteria sp.]|nr:DNA repair protein RecO [Candidatus Eisenbacteria bacterium]